MEDFIIILVLSNTLRERLGVDPDGHYFVVLYISINKKSIFVSAVVTYRTPHLAHSCLEN